MKLFDTIDINLTVIITNLTTWLLHQVWTRYSNAHKTPFSSSFFPPHLSETTPTAHPSTFFWTGSEVAVSRLSALSLPLSPRFSKLDLQCSAPLLGQLQVAIGMIPRWLSWRVGTAQSWMCIFPSLSWGSLHLCWFFCISLCCGSEEPRHMNPYHQCMVCWDHKCSAILWRQYKLSWDQGTSWKFLSWLLYFSNLHVPFYE